MIPSQPNWQVSYTSGGVDLLTEIQPLWALLNEHHATVSPHFGSEFQAKRFSERKAKLLHKYADGQLRVDLAWIQKQVVGYLVSGITADGLGEIESIYVAEPYRGQGLADELMRCGLAWLEAQGAHTKVIAVAVGNERAYSFYARYGFFPRLVMLKQSEPQSV